jgi:hypothetical protein
MGKQLAGPYEIYLTLLTLFQLGRNNFYQHDSAVYHVTKPSWNRVS